VTVNVEVSEDVFNRAAEIARSQRITVADVFAAACTEHIAAWERLQRRSQQGDRVKFLEILARVPDVDPDEHDRL
jgi:hypothetical protein